MEHLISHQIDKRINQANLYITKKLKALLEHLKTDESIDDDCKNLFNKKDQLSINLDFFLEVGQILLLYIGDSTKIQMLEDLLSRYYEDGSHSEFSEEIIKVYHLIISSISNAETKKAQALKTASFLDSNPCSRSLAAKIERIIKESYPEFHF